MRKDALVKTAALARVNVPASGIVTLNDTAESRGAAITAAGDKGPWVVKDVVMNNALGLRFASDAGVLREAINAALASGASRAVVQAWETRPMLYRGSKWHARVNVALVGKRWLYVHRDAVAHVACEPWGGGGEFNQLAEVTNNVAQRHDARYSRETHTLLVDAVVGESHRAPLFDAINTAIGALFDACHAHRLAFLSLPQSFELFGFDILVRDDGVPLVLEVNGGPALESAAWPDMCERVVRDTVSLFADGLDMDALGGDSDSDSDGDGDGFVSAWPHPPEPYADSGWLRIR